MRLKLKRFSMINKFSVVLFVFLLSLTACSKETTQTPAPDAGTQVESPDASLKTDATPLAPTEVAPTVPTEVVPTIPATPAEVTPAVVPTATPAN